MGQSASKSSSKTAELEAYSLDNDHALLKEKRKSLNESLRGPLRLSGMDNIANTKFVASGRADNRSLVART